MYLPYKEYLVYFNKYHDSSPLKTLGTSFLVLLLVLGGFATSITYYVYNTELPAHLEGQRLNSIADIYTEAKEQRVDVVNLFKVAGAKTSVIATASESSSSASGYFSENNDIEKTISKIQDASDKIEAKKQSLKTLELQTSPVLYQNLTTYLSDNSTLFNNLLDEQEFRKDILQTQGPDFYLPQLTNDNLWIKPKKESLVDYYQGSKEGAKRSLDKLLQNTPPSEFANYYALQTQYLNLVILVSDNILASLDTPESSDLDSSTSIERAYQFLNNVRNQKEGLITKLTAEKGRLSTLSIDLGKAQEIEAEEKQIEENLKNTQIPDQSKIFTYLDWVKLTLGKYI